MSRWTIGNLVFGIPLTGQFQPEEFNESLSAQYDDLAVVGGVMSTVLKGWKPREITISFVVDALNTGAPEERIDPEYIWNVITNMIQPPENGAGVGLGPTLVSGNLVPNTGGPYRNAPLYADLGLPGWENVLVVIPSASIKRTHIGKDGRAIRATITLHLKQAAKLEKQTAQQRTTTAKQGTQAVGIRGGV